MKILIVSPYFAPAWGFGGVPKMTYEIGKHLVKEGHEVHAYTTDAFDVKKRIEKLEENIDGIQVKRFKNISNKLASGSKLFFPKGFATYLKKSIQSFDLIFLSDFRSFQNAWVISLAEKYKIPHVIAAYGQIPRGGGWRKPLKAIFDYFWGYRILRNAKKCLAQTDHEKEMYMNMGVKKENIEIMPLGIDVSEFVKLPPKNAFRIKHQIPNTDKLVAFIGRFHEYKLTDLMIEGFAQLNNRIANMKFVIAGRDDGYLSHIKSLIKKYQIEDKVIFPGALYGDDKLALLNDTDVFTLAPSFYEETSVAALEALACGTPVVITEQCAVPHLDEYQAGITVHFDVKEYVDALEKVISGYKLRSEMGENANKLIQEVFSWEKVLPRMIEVFQTAITKK